MQRCASARKPFPIRVNRPALLDTVVGEFVRALQVLDQLQTNGGPENPNGRPSFDFPRTIESIVISATLPRQASCCKRRLGLDGAGGSKLFRPLRSTTLSGVTLGVKAIGAPQRQRAAFMIEAEQPLFRRAPEMN